jgi:hypothetical protein
MVRISACPLQQRPPSSQLRALQPCCAGGLGKTTMAKKLHEKLLGPATRFQRAAFVTLDFQVEATTCTSSDKDCRLQLQSCLEQLSGHKYSGPDHDLRRQYKQELAKGKVLLVLDNFHTLTQLDCFLTQDLLRDPGSTVIVTSRSSDPTPGGITKLAWSEVRAANKMHGANYAPVPQLMQQLPCAGEDAEAARAPPGAAALRRCAAPVPHQAGRDCFTAGGVRQDAAEGGGGMRQAAVGCCNRGRVPCWRGGRGAVAGTLCCICDVTLATCLHQRCSQVVLEALRSGDDPIHGAYGESEDRLARVLLHSLVDMRPAAVSMFLDVACVLQGQPAASAKAVWQRRWPEESDRCFRLLLTRNLLTTQWEDDDFGQVEVLQMHDVLMWLGRCVVRGESGAAQLAEHVGSRLWVQDGSVVGGRCGQVWTLLQQLPPVRPALSMDPPLTCAILVCRATAPPPLLQQH